MRKQFQVCGFLTLLGGWGLSGQAQTLQATLTLVPSGISSQAGYYAPQRLLLGPAKPIGVKKLPSFVGTPQYGSMPFGSAKSNQVAVVLDESPDGKSAKLYVDTNGDGDLTNDAVVNWERRSNKATGQDGKPIEMVVYTGSGSVQARHTEGRTAPVQISFYRFGTATAKLRGLPVNTLFYYRDYGMKGSLTLDGKAYDVLLLDDATRGRFDAEKGLSKQPGVTLLIDRDGDGKFDPRYERYALATPFNIGGKSYALDAVSANGTKLTLRKATTEVAEVPIPKTLKIGEATLAFTQPVISGKTINFPSDYKGKLVMLDFWATWCPPCREEIPGLVKVYQKYHDRGFEVLGVSLDQKDKLTEVNQFLQDHGMTWEQVYDGKYWEAAVSQQYGVDSIPRAFLVDGSTGKIVAMGDDLRGDALDKTIAKGLEGLKTASK